MADGEAYLRRLSFEEFVAELDTVRVESEAVFGAQADLRQNWLKQMAAAEEKTAEQKLDDLGEVCVRLTAALGVTHETCNRLLLLLVESLRRLEEAYSE